MRKRIYLDNNASTAADPRVADAWIASLSLAGNPSSLHSFGQEARGQLTKARQTIASYLSVKPAEIIFTSGGTEALNMVIRGAHRSGHIISSVAEHAAVYTTLQQFPSVTYLPTGLQGAVSPAAVQSAIQPDTRLIVLMAVNNETGVKTDIAAIAAIAESAGIPFIVDGVALLGKEPFFIPKGVSAMCFSGHKLHAPKGIGFAFVRNTLKLQPFITGGEQEFGRRGGTENLSGIIALAERSACSTISPLPPPAWKLCAMSLNEYFSQKYPTQSFTVQQAPALSTHSTLLFPESTGNPSSPPLI